jgi:GNAT superfamily N-acetyltransferase
MIIRPATKADGPAILSLVEALADYEKLEPPDATARRRLLEDAFGAEPKLRFWVAEADSVICAYAAVFFTYSSFLARPTLYLEDLFVHPDARRAGIATAMLARLKAEAQRAGCGRMEWTVLDWNTPARALYEGLGATVLEEWKLVRTVL